MTENTKTPSNSKPDHWIERFCPSGLRFYAYIIRFLKLERFIPPALHPYIELARLDRPIGIWLLLIPSYWALALSKNTQENAALLYTLFFFGAIIMRSAGCVINDFWDRDLDQKVARTRTRPLASQKVPTYGAIVFLIVLLATGLLILIQMNWLTITLGMLSLLLIVTYPLMKRITYWPQAFLGLTFNFGVLMGWSAATGTITISALILYLSAILWTLGYDTIYAHQDIEDDTLAGIKSTALKFGKHSKIWVGGFYALSWVLLASAAHMTLDSKIVIVFLVPAGLHLKNQIKNWDLQSPTSALNIFKSNADYGWMVIGALWVYILLHAFFTGTLLT